jgi:hypothetical protein
MNDRKTKLIRNWTTFIILLIFIFLTWSFSLRAETSSDSQTAQINPQFLRSAYHGRYPIILSDQSLFLQQLSQ